MVQTLCVGCHSLNNITQGWGYDKQGWDELIASMVALPPDTRNQVSTYLGEHFSAKTRPATVVVPGSARVDIKEWIVPSLGSRPHDPLGASDGSLWWAGMFANVLGRLDPKTGQMKEYKLKTANSGPHGLTEDKRTGNIWFSANTGGYIGKLDPKTGEITEYKMPDPAARDPHTPVFDHNGQLWFTVQNGNFVGRLNPQTGDIKLVKMPGTYNPYGMVMTSKGVPVVCMFFTNKIASFDPDHHGNEGIQPAGCCRASAPHRHHQRRHDLVCRLRPRLSRPLESGHRRSEGLAIAERPAIAAVRHHRHQGHHLLQRIRRAPQYAGALRPQDGEVPVMGDPVGRRRGSQHEHDERRQPGHGRKRREPRGPGHLAVAPNTLSEK